MTSDHFRQVGAHFAALPNVELIAAADPNAELRDEARKLYGISALYVDYREMLERETLDAVLIYGDNASKPEIVEAAAAQGIHVCQDKPIASTLAGADRIVAAVEKNGIKLEVTYYPYFSASYGRAKDMLTSGKLGKVYLARSIVGHAGPKEVGCSHFFYDWLYRKDLNGGGSFIDEACYSISNMLDFMGPIAEVSAFMGQIGSRELPTDVEDNSVAILRFQSGALGVIDGKWGQIGPMPFGSSFHGTEGTLTMGWEGLRLYSRTAIPEDVRGWVDIPAPRAPRPGIGNEAEHFVRAIVDDKPFEGAASAGGARAIQEVIEAAYRSAETGQTIKLPL